MHAERVGVGTDVDVARRDVAVFGGDHARDRADAQAVRLQLARVAIDLDLAARGAAHGHRTHAGDARQRGGHLVVQDLVQRRKALVRRGGEQHDRQVRGAELEDDRVGHAVRKHGIDHVQLVADAVGRGLDVHAVVEGQGQQGDVLLGLGVQLLEVLHAVEGVLEDLGHVGLDVLCVGALVGGHHHDRIGLRELGDGRPAQGEDTQDGEGDEQQGGRHGMLDRRTVDAHRLTSTLSPDLRVAKPPVSTCSPASRPERISYRVPK